MRPLKRQAAAFKTIEREREREEEMKLYVRYVFVNKRVRNKKKIDT